MDVIEFVRHLYKNLRQREVDIFTSMSLGNVKNWEDYKMLVGEVRGLSLAQEEIKALLEKTHEDVGDIID